MKEYTIVMRVTIEAESEEEAYEEIGYNLPNYARTESVRNIIEEDLE